MRILLDCGSPDWRPEPSSSSSSPENYPWEDYCAALREYVPSHRYIYYANWTCRCAPTVDLVLLSHGDLAHSGLYPYAYSRWNLKAPAYSTLPVQAMARIAVAEDVEGIRDEEDVGGDPAGPQDPENEPEEEQESTAMEGEVAEENKGTGKFVATMFEVHEAFDSVNAVRYSQPTHLQGTYFAFSLIVSLANLVCGRQMSRVDDNTF